MNKLIIFPLAIMVLLALFTSVYANSIPDDPSNTEGYYSLEILNGEVYVVNNNIAPPKYYPTVAVMGEDGTDDYMFMTDDGESHIFDPDQKYSDDPFRMWGMNALIGIVGVAIITVGALGLTIFGSGFTTFTQQLALTGIIYLGIWGALTIVSSPLILSDEIGIFGDLLYFMLTASYVIGMVQNVSSDGGD